MLELEQFQSNEGLIFPCDKIGLKTPKVTSHSERRTQVLILKNFQLHVLLAVCEFPIQAKLATRYHARLKTSNTIEFNDLQIEQYDVDQLSDLVQSNDFSISKTVSI